MAPIKFEENIKDKLEKRTLSPSSQSWSQLADRLDKDEKRSRKPMFWWLGIAAGLLIMMAVSVQFFNSNDSEEISPQVVEEKFLEDQLEIETPNNKDKKIIELANEDETLEIEKERIPVVKEPQIIDYKKVIPKKSEPKTKLVKQNSSNTLNKTINKEEVLNNEVDELLNDAVIKNAVADAMANLKSENSSVTDREIDSLLKVASKEIFRNNLNKETIKVTDAEALLMSVEEEMGQSFRTKVFEALKESYKTVKTAVADRNN